MKRRYRRVRAQGIGSEQEGTTPVVETGEGKCFAWNGAKPLNRISIQNRNLYFSEGLQDTQQQEREVMVCLGCKSVTTVLLRGSPKTGDGRSSLEEISHIQFFPDVLNALAEH